MFGWLRPAFASLTRNQRHYIFMSETSIPNTIRISGRVAHFDLEIALSTNFDPKTCFHAKKIG